MLDCKGQTGCGRWQEEAGQGLEQVRAVIRLMFEADYSVS